MNENTIKVDGQELLAFIEHDLLLNRKLKFPLTLNTDLIDNGIIDSLSLIQLVTHLEKEFSIKVADADVIPDNFQTLSKIVSYLERKLQE